MRPADGKVVAVRRIEGLVVAEQRGLVGGRELVVNVPRRERIAGGRVIVEPCDELILVRPRFEALAEVVVRAQRIGASIRRRREAQERRRIGIETIGRYPVVWERPSGRGIGDDDAARQQGREIAGSKVHGRERPQLPRGALDLAAGFPIHEEEQRVLANRAAQIRAELIPIQPGLGGAEVVARGERVVPVELPGRAVKRVRARLGGDVHVCAGRSAVGARVGAGLDAELPDRVERWREREIVAVQVHRGHAVVDEAVLHVGEAAGRDREGRPDRSALAIGGDVH